MKCMDVSSSPLYDQLLAGPDAAHTTGLPCTLHSIMQFAIFLFGHSQNITITAKSTLDEPEVLWGMESGRIYDLIFDNVQGDTGGLGPRLG